MIPSDTVRDNKEDLGSDGRGDVGVNVLGGRVELAWMMMAAMKLVAG
jgi:hypothetical protein